MTAHGEFLETPDSGDLPESLNRRIAWLYWIGAAGLAPWIVYLYLSQAPRHEARQLRTLAVGLILAMMISLLGSAWFCWRMSKWTTMTASFAATTTLIAAWFRTLTHSGGSNSSESIPVFLTVVTAIVIVCVMTIRSEFSSRSARSREWQPFALVGASIVLIPSLVIVLTAVADQKLASHLRLAWTGLDVFELVAMAATGFALQRESPVVIVTATITGALLICDAWINVVPTLGAARWEGIALVFVELPLAIFSLRIAARASKRNVGLLDQMAG